MHCGEPLSFKATSSRAAAAAVVATPHFGHRQQHPCSIEFNGCLSPSIYPKPPSISSRSLQRSILRTIAYIPRAAKDDAIAQPAAAAVGEHLYMPEEWPDFLKMKVAPNIEYKFFNRNKEYDMIMDHLSGKPSKPLLLLGPINSGKTALLKSIIAKEKSRVLYLNCGVKDVSSPELMARQLRNLARKLPSRLGMQGMKTLASKLSSVSKLLALGDNVLDVAVPGEKVLNAFFEDFFPEDKATDLTAVIDTYDLLLENIPRGQNKPIIVIDEVNAMKLWRTEDEVALKQLLEFLKRTCKENALSHIVFSSSDFFMVSWLSQKGLNGTQRKVDVLGDLTSAEAFVYVCGGKGRNKRGFEEDWPGLMSQSEQTLALGMTPEDWKKVWSVCGGNMYLLQNCVTEATRSSSWDKGVAETLSEPQKDVATALERPRRIPPPTDSSAPRSWESEHYKAVLRLIAANPYHAVRQEDAEAALRGVGIDKNVTADEVLLSMVEYNVVSLRPYSDMARDIPREAFFKMEWGVEDEEDVVTMPSPAHLAAALLLETKFQKQDEAEGKSAQDVEAKTQANS